MCIIFGKKNQHAHTGRDDACTLILWDCLQFAGLKENHVGNVKSRPVRDRIHVRSPRRMNPDPDYFNMDFPVLRYICDNYFNQNTITLSGDISQIM